MIQSSHVESLSMLPLASAVNAPPETATPDGTLFTSRGLAAVLPPEIAMGVVRAGNQ